jgi:subtilisin family serine protease
MAAEPPRIALPPEEQARDAPSAPPPLLQIALGAGHQQPRAIGTVPEKEAETVADVDGNDHDGIENASAKTESNDDSNTHTNVASEGLDTTVRPCSTIPTPTPGASAWLVEHTVNALGLTSVSDKIPAGVWLMGAPMLWQQGVTGAGVRVGVIDSGIDDSHRDLRGKVVLRRDYVNDGVSPTRFHPHGTHVAGRIAANGPMLKGVAPDATLIDYRVVNLNGHTTSTTVTNAVLDAVNDKCHIINMSLVVVYTKSLHDAIKNATRNGILVIASAGNSGRVLPPPQIQYPADFPEVFSIAALEFDPANGRVQYANYSNCAPNVDGAAIGSNVISTIPGGKYGIMSGTSMAASHASGLAALLHQKASICFPKEPVVIMERPRVYIMLKSTTVDILTKGVDWCSGAGMLTVYPIIPTRDTTNREWFIPGFSDGQPSDEGEDEPPSEGPA